MRARIFSGDSWMGGVLACVVGAEEWVEGEEEKAELRSANEEGSGSLRRAIIVRDMVPLEERVSERRK